MTRYLVTGGAGFIGSNFVKHILAQHGKDARIMVLDALTYAANPTTLAEEVEQGLVELRVGDIGNPDLVSAILEEFDPHYIVNFAAETHVDRSITGPRAFMETNILGTQNMLECARRAWSGRREGHLFLQVSTDEVYGALEKDVPEGRPIDGLPGSVAYGTEMFTELTPLSPHSPYSAAKASADLIAGAYHDTYGLPVCITRCSNNYGPRQFPEKLIPLVINNILENRPIPVYGDGSNVRDWLYVDDHCSAIEAVLRHGRPGRVYNIGGYNEQTNINIVGLILDTVASLMRERPELQKLLAPGHTVDAIDRKMIKFVADRPGHDLRYAIDPTRISEELGWKPRVPFTEGIKRTVEWYLDNRAWVESVLTGEYRDYYTKMYNNR